MKKIIKLTLLLLAFLLPATAVAHDFEVNGIYYNIDGNNAIVTYRDTFFNLYNEYTGTVVIPESVTYNGNTYSVTTIGHSAFRECTGLTSITIPNSVTTISNFAFYGCTGLTSINIPNSVTTIGRSAFYNCTRLTSITIPSSVTAIYGEAFRYCSGLTSITIPNSVTTIGFRAFYGCTGLKSISIGDGVTTIGNHAFHGCTGLSSITIPNSVTTIEEYAFSSCSGLTNITVANGNHTYDSRNNCNAIIETASNTLITGCQNTVIPNSVTAIVDYAFSNCTGLTSITIPNSVTTICEYAFSGCTGLTSITIPNSVTTIEDYAFSRCAGLTSITIPNSVTTIGNGAFSGCTGLTSITIPNSVTTISNYAFCDCTGLTSITIPNSVTTIEDCAFSDCTGLTSITIPNSVTTIGSSAFSGCTGLTSITIGNSVTTIEDYAFSGCSGLTSITIPSSVTDIGNHAFQGCSSLETLIFNAISCNDFQAESSPFYNLNLSTIYLGNNVQKIPAYFANGLKKVSSITIPNSVTNIGNYAFNGCRGLTETLTIPNSITAIGNYTFSGCSGLTGSLAIPNSVASIGNYAFSGCTGLTSITIGNSVTTIEDCTFFGCTGLTSITIGSGVTTIEDYAFSECTGLTSITIPNSVTTIEDYAFSDCTRLSSITIPNSVTAIGSNAFSGTAWYNNQPNGVIYVGLVAYKYKGTMPIGTTISIREGTFIIAQNIFCNCTGLTSITIPNSVTTIGDYAFYGCSGLTKITIPNSVTAIGNYTFSGCSGLTDTLTIPNSVTTIGNNSFFGCSGLTIINIPNSITTIGNYTFSGCSGLISISIPNSVTTIGNYAFSGCSGLTSVSIPESVNTINNNAFFNCNGLTSVNINDLEAWCRIVFRNNTSNPLYYAHHLYLNGTEVTELTVPNSVTTINDYAFYGCSGITKITMPYSVTTIGNYAFFNCKGLAEITIPYSVTSIGIYAFYGCSAITSLNYNAESCADFSANESDRPFYNLNISTINIGDSVQRIPAYFVNGLTKLKNVIFGKSVTSIGDYAFYDCSALVGNLSLPKSLIDIGKQAFNNIATIESVTCAAETPPTWNDLAMFTTNVYNHSPLYVPIGSERAYMSDQCWGQFSTIIGKNMNDEVQATGISLNQSQMNLMIGGSSQLIATVMPDSTTNKVVTWASNDPTVATVNTNGLVSAIGVGTATITATTTDGSNLSASCVVTVTEDLSDFDNFLFIDDMEAFHGDTLVIPVKMINEASIISFQTDIFLPEGLELLQEDGEYIIDPSERMTRTHSIMSNAVSNGAVRIICYSSNYKPFTGNSGDDLFYISVKVADDAEGDYSIQLKNTLFTTSTFEELTAPDIAANIHVKAYIPGDANNSGTVTVTDVVVTSQYVLEMNPQPFNFDAADVNDDGTITVTDVSRIAWMVLNPSLNAPLRAPALWNNGDLMSGNDITIAAGETLRVSIVLNNEMDYTAFQCDVNLPEGLTANNFQMTDRASRHAFDVNTLSCGKIRALCYSPAMDGIHGHEGALLTFDVTANGDVNGHITIDGIELVTTACQTVRLDAFTIGVNNASNVNELVTGKTISKIEYFNLAGQQIESVESGVTLVITTYTDGSRSTSKVIR